MSSGQGPFQRRVPAYRMAVVWMDLPGIDRGLFVCLGGVEKVGEEVRPIGPQPPVDRPSSARVIARPVCSPSCVAQAWQQASQGWPAAAQSSRRRCSQAGSDAGGSRAPPAPRGRHRPRRNRRGSAPGRSRAAADLEHPGRSGRQPGTDERPHRGEPALSDVMDHSLLASARTGSVRSPAPSIAGAYAATAVVRRLTPPRRRPAGRPAATRACRRPAGGP